MGAMTQLSIHHPASPMFTHQCAPAAITVLRGRVFIAGSSGGDLTHDIALPPSDASHSKQQKWTMCQCRPSASVHSGEKMIWRAKAIRGHQKWSALALPTLHSHHWAERHKPHHRLGSVGAGARHGDCHG